eukprot:s1965_g10.t1
MHSLQTCELHEVNDQALSCGEAALGERLPGRCFHMQEPAAFAIMRSSLDTTSHRSTMIGLVKLFKNGMCIFKTFGDTNQPRGSLEEIAPLREQTIKDCWKTDRVHIYLEMPENMFQDLEEEDDALFRRSDDVKDGSNFIHYTGNFFLDGRNLDPQGGSAFQDARLPGWWTAKFVEGADDFLKADAMMGCLIARYQNGTCYQARIGQVVNIFQSSEHNCPDLDANFETGQEYTYVFSTDATQTYADPEPCLPLASRHELQLDITDLRHEGSNAPKVDVATMETTCRMYLRFVVDLADLSCVSSLHEAWKLARLEAEAADPDLRKKDHFYVPTVRPTEDEE